MKGLIWKASALLCMTGMASLGLAQDQTFLHRLSGDIDEVSEGKTVENETGPVEFK